MEGALRRAPAARGLARPCLAPRLGLRTPRTICVTSRAATLASDTDVQGRAPDAGAAATTSGAPATAVAAAAAAASGASGRFDWTSHWYPVGVVADLDPQRPHATHLLGIPLALWRDKQGAWHAVEDKCPHRLAPLSEGRLEADGTLQCAYHGWQFDGRGVCTHIPQLRGDDKAHQVACSSRRACVRSYPCSEVHGLLWVLPDSSDAGWAKAEEQPTPNAALPELLGGPAAEGWKQCTQWFARDLAISYNTLLENVLDPSHVPFAHHGVQGRRENEKGTLTKPGEVGVDGFEFLFDAKSTRFPPGNVVFKAPVYARYGSVFRTLQVYAVPTRPGWSRLYATLLTDTRQPSPLPWLVARIFSLVEGTSWLEHIIQRHPVLDGDTYMLHVQERLLEQRGNDWQGSFFMPAPADGSVVATRKWLDDFGAPVPTCEPGTPLPPPMSKREVLDRYSQHTNTCRHCRKALRNVDFATVAAAACGLLAALWLVARAVVGQPLLAPATGLGVLAVAACGGVVAVLRKLREQFFFVDYVHAERK